MTEDIEIRLNGGDDPKGEIDLAVLGPLATALAKLSTGLVRWSADRSGPGRTPHQVRELSRIRLRQVDKGSTKLAVGRGTDEFLDLHDDLALQADDQFWRVLGVIGRGESDPGLPAPVRESAAELIGALAAAGASVTFTSSTTAARSLSMHPRELDREIWLEPQELIDPSRTVFGLLEMVDITQRRFRIRDDVGNSIALEHVADVDEAARLVASQVRAEGALWSRRGHPVIRNAVLAGSDPVALDGDPAAAWQFELAKPGPVQPDDEGLSDDEFGTFLAAALDA